MVLLLLLVILLVVILVLLLLLLVLLLVLVLVLVPVPLAIGREVGKHQASPVSIVDQRGVQVYTWIYVYSSIPKYIQIYLLLPS